MEILEFTNKKECYEYFKNNASFLNEMFIVVKRGNPKNAGDVLPYLDAVEVALCFGWIDSILRKVDDKLVQRFSPRSNKSSWTELNKERCRRLIKLGEMTEKGLEVCPNLDEEFIVPDYIELELEKHEKAYEFLSKISNLYRKIRISHLINLYKTDTKSFQKALKNLIEKSELGETIGEWNDYGRLL